MNRRLDVQRLRAAGGFSHWGKPMPAWYWRARNGRIFQAAAMRAFYVSTNGHLDESGVALLPDGSILRYQVIDGVRTEEIEPPPEPAEPYTDDDRARYLEWAAARPPALRDWLAQFPTVDDFPVCWRITDTHGHYVLDTFDEADDGTYTCQVHHVAGPDAMMLASMFGHGVFGVPLDTLEACGCGDFTEQLAAAGFDGGSVIESITYPDDQGAHDGPEPEHQDQRQR